MRDLLFILMLAMACTVDADASEKICSKGSLEKRTKCLTAEIQKHQATVESFYRGDIFGGMWPSREAYEYFFVRQVDFFHLAAKSCRNEIRCVHRLFQEESQAIAKKQLSGDGVRSEAEHNMTRKFQVLYHSDSAFMKSKFGLSRRKQK